MTPPSRTPDDGPNEDGEFKESLRSDFYKACNLVAQDLGTSAYEHLWEGGAILRRPKEKARVRYPPSSRPPHPQYH